MPGTDLFDEAMKLLSYANLTPGETVHNPVLADETVKDKMDFCFVRAFISHALESLEILFDEGEIDDIEVSCYLKYRSLQKDWRSPRQKYSDYLASDEWKIRAEASKERAGRRCQVCNATGQLDTHHRTYERIGEEAETDLIVLCRDCHTLFHENGKLAR